MFRPGRMTNFQWKGSPAEELPPSLFPEATQGQNINPPPLTYTLRQDAV